MYSSALYAHWLRMRLYAVVFVLIVGIARHPRWIRQEEFDKPLTKRGEPRLFVVRQCSCSPMGSRHFRSRIGRLEVGCLSGFSLMAASRRHRPPSRLVVAAIASSIPVVGISTVLRRSCPATRRKIETETRARSFRRPGSHHVGSQNTIRYVPI